MKYATLILCLLLLACDPAVPAKPPWQEISGRDEFPTMGRIVRHPVYRARVPTEWRRMDPRPDQSIFDSTLANVEFQIGDRIQVFVHNFPADRLEERIPPGAQTARWQRQFSSFSEDPLLKPIAFSGFAGFYFEGQGDLKGEEKRVFAWALQLPTEHFQRLLISGTPEEERFFRQMRADFTIKAVGDPKEMEIHKEAIHGFANSFELIQVIPEGA